TAPRGITPLRLLAMYATVGPGGSGGINAQPTPPIGRYQHGMWRTGRLLALVVLASVLGTLAVPSPASATDEGDEWSFVALVNQSRAQAGLPPLAVLAGLR